MTAPLPRRRFKMLAVLAALGWTLAACALADHMLRYDWEYSCGGDAECEWEDGVRAKAEGKR